MSWPPHSSKAEQVHSLDRAVVDDFRLTSRGCDSKKGQCGSLEFIDSRSFLSAALGFFLFLGLLSQGILDGAPRGKYGRV